MYEGGLILRANGIAAFCLGRISGEAAPLVFKIEAGRSERFRERELEPFSDTVK
jgi:hypothetical protein